MQLLKFFKQHPTAQTSEELLTESLDLFTNATAKLEKTEQLASEELTTEQEALDELIAEHTRLVDESKTKTNKLQSIINKASTTKRNIEALLNH